MKTNLPLTKICSSCGLEKPLAAFILKTGTLGSTYGDICNACRSQNTEKKSSKEEESTTSRTGMRIDYRTKNQIELEKSKFQKFLNEDYHRERNELSKENIEAAEKNREIAAGEKKIREKTLSEKHSFLSRPTETNLAGRNENLHIQNQNNVTKNAIEKQATVNMQDNENKREQQTQSANTQQTVTTQQTHNKNQQRSFIEKRSFLTKTVTLSTEQIKKQHVAIDKLAKDTQIKKNQQAKSLFTQKSHMTKMELQKRQEKLQKEKELVDFVKNTWGPRSRGR